MTGAIAPIAIAAALLSALVHASWNLFLKGSAGDRLVDTAVMGLGGSLFGVVLMALFGAPVAGAWPFILASSAIHLVYWTALTRGYGAGDMSHVYTIARGVAPALVTLGAMLFAGEVPGLGQGLGIIAISAGVLLVGVNRQAPLPATGWALLTGAAIAGFLLLGPIGALIAGALGWLFSSRSQEREIREQMESAFADIDAGVRTEAARVLTDMAEKFLAALATKVDEVRQDTSHNIGLLEEQLRHSDSETATRRAKIGEDLARLGAGAEQRKLLGTQADGKVNAITGGK